MSVQNRLDIVNKSFILDASLSATKDSLTILQDAGRAAPLVFGTLMAKVAASGKYVPFINEAATDGTALPIAVYIGADIPTADLVAGDVVDKICLLGGDVIIDKNRLVIENAKTLATVIGAVTIHAKTVEDVLNDRGIFMGESDDSTSFEN